MRLTSRVVKRLASYGLFIVLCVLCTVLFLACGNDDDVNAVPHNLSVGSDMYLRWDKVSNAGLYIVEFDGIEYEAETNCFDVLALTAQPAKHTARVMAVLKNGKESDWSETYSYEEKDVRWKYAFRFYFLDAPQEVGITANAKSVCSGKVFIPATVMIDDMRYSVTEIDRGAFKNCDNMTCVVIPDTVTVIPSSAFSHCSALERVLLPNGLTKIDSLAFCDCTRLKDVVFPDTLVSVKSHAFVRTGLTKLRIPKSVTDVSGAFGNDALVRVTVDERNVKYYSKNNCVIRKLDRALVLGCNSSVIPDGVEIIDGDAFLYSGIEHIDIPSSVKHINWSAFINCDELKSVRFSDGLEELQRQSFISCGKIEKIYIPKTVIKLEGAFGAHTDMAEIEVDPDNPVYRSENNCIFKREEPVLVLGCKNSVVPDNVEKIEDCAFCGCELNEFAFPSQLKIIGRSAFANTNLTSVSLPVGLETVESSAFGLTPLSEVYLPRTVKYIGESAFASTNLGSITIPDSVETVKINAFEDVAVYVACDLMSFPSGWVFMQSAGADITNIKSSFTKSCVFFGCELEYGGEYPYVVSVNDKIRFTDYDELSEDWGAPLRNGYEYKGFSEQAGGEVSIAAYTAESGKLCALSNRQKQSLAADTVLYTVWSEI